MKTYSIGRDLNCDIVINDSTDVISRRHALLNVTSGKMTIIDQSSNGTYVNGIRISQNVPVPVTRKDVVSLAHVAKLDWEQVPKSNPNPWIWYVIAIVAAVGITIGIIFGVKGFKSNGDSNDNGIPSQIELNDSTSIKQSLDSIKNIERQDSIKKAAKKSRRDSDKATNDAVTKTKTESTEAGTDSVSNGSKNNKSGQKNKRAIG